VEGVSTLSKLGQLPHSLAGYLEAFIFFASGSRFELLFLRSCFPNLIFSKANVSRDENGGGIGQARFLARAERRCALN